MQLHLSIRVISPAFLAKSATAPKDPVHDEPRARELARILRELATVLEAQGAAPGFCYRLKDTNGLDVGNAHITQQFHTRKYA